MSRTVILSLILFKVNVSFPHQFWHVQGGLLNAKLENRTRPLQVVQTTLKLRKLNPRLAVGWIPLKLLFEECSAPHKLVELLFKLNVPFEKLVLGAHSNGLTQRLACRLELHLSDFELCFHDPDFGKGPLLVWYQFKTLLVYLPYSFHIAIGHLFPNGIENPKIDVPPPMSFFLRGRDLSNRPFVDVSNTIHVTSSFFQPREIEPRIVVLGVFFDLLLILHPSLCQYDILDSFSVTKLLLECRIRLVQRSRPRPRQPVQSVFVDRSRSFVLLQLCLISGIGDKELLVYEIISEGFDGDTINVSNKLASPVLFLKPGPTHPVVGLWMDHGEPLKYSSGTVVFSVSDLELNVGQPCCFVRLPTHPPLEDLSNISDLAQRFFHVNL